MKEQLFSLPYGRGSQAIDLSEHEVLAVLSGGTEELPQDDADEATLVRYALDHPIGRPPLGRVLHPGDTVCIVMSDITRAWQRMHVYLPLLVEKISAAGIPDSHIQFLCATGSHRPLSREEAKTLLGPLLSQRFNVISHDCHDESNLSEIGTTALGTVVKLNRLALEADHLIITGGIVFHDLAGWGGGKKSILPGIAGYESIMSNHALSLGDTPGSGIHPCIRCGSIEGNRLNADMQEAAEMVDPTFLLNVLINEKGRIGAAVAGHYLEAFEAGKILLDHSDRVMIDRLADFAVVSVGGYPKDIDFYQSTKALSSAREAVVKGGVILLYCACEDGVGHPEVSELLTAFTSHTAREMEMRRAFTVSKFAGFLASQMAEDYQVYCVTELDPGILTGIGFKVFQDSAEAMAHIEKEHGIGLKTYVIPSASNILPGIKR
ncbi:MAG: nickel-dependent lactate racemase [Bacillota bacterium]|nr:nickel-dependent lactate racemase [Bacillota bacterium]MDW7676502.1 nickel-dependent lactate racemase [Bacillota bacterium]